MQIVVRFLMLIIALGAGALAYVVATRAFPGGLIWPLYAGQARGLIFIVVMAAAAVILVWVAVRLNDGQQR